MRVVVKFDIDADIIDCPENITDNLIEYSNKFMNWLFDKQNNHSYWWYENGEKAGCSYRSEAFVEWLNKFVFDKSLNKAKVLECGVNNWDKNLPYIFF
ncbi:hypothetical protein [Clostridium sp. Marseille-Q7071]